MKLLVCIFSIWILLKNISYSIYEYKINNNKSGAISVLLFNIICFVFANIILFVFN